MVNEDEYFSLTPDVVDVDASDLLVFSIVRQPSWASFDSSTGELAGTPNDSDVGLVSRITVSVSDGLESQSLAPFDMEVMGVSDKPTGDVTTEGTAAEDQVLQAMVNLEDMDGIGAVSLQWFRGETPIVNANNDTYLLGQSDVGKPDWVAFDTSTGSVSGLPGDDAAGMIYNFLITVSDGSSTVALPVFDLRVTNKNDLPIGDLLVTGLARENEVLTIVQSVSVADGLGNISYQWMREGAIVEEAVAGTYLLDDIDVGSSISAAITYIDGHGNEERIASAETDAVENVNFE